MDLKIEALKKFGLTDGEIKVYLEALKNDDLTPFKIANLTKIPRTTVYDILMGLSLKGLIELKQSDGFSKQQTLVKAKNPSVLRTILQNKRKELISVEADILDVLKELKGDYHKNESNADFKFFAGINGAKEVYFDSFSEEEIKIPSFTWDLQMPMDIFGVKEMNEDVSKVLQKERMLNLVQHDSTKIASSPKAPRNDDERGRNDGSSARRGLSSGTTLFSSSRVPPLSGRGDLCENKELSPLNDWTKHVFSYQVGRDPQYLENTEFRYIEDSSFEIFLRLNIKGNFVRIVCAYEEEVWGLKIRSHVLSATFKAIFLQNWKVATPITKELVKSWGESEFLAEHKRKKRV